MMKTVAATGAVAVAILLSSLTSLLAPPPLLALETFLLPYPCRVLDTRLISPGTPISPTTSSPFSFGVRYGTVEAQGEEMVHGTPCSIPAEADAVIMSLVVVDPASGGWVKVTPYGTGFPLSSRMNVTYSTNRSVEMQVKMGEYTGEVGEELSLASSISSAHYVVDLVGWLWEPEEVCEEIARNLSGLRRFDDFEAKERGMILSARNKAEGEHRSRFMGDRWTITTASAQTWGPADRLTANDDLLDYWAAWGQRKSHTWISAVSDIATEARTIGAVAVLGTNRVYPTAPPGTGSYLEPVTYRVRIDSYPLADRIRPGFTITTQTNLTGTLADITGPVDPPTTPPAGYTATKLESTSATTDTFLSLTFTNHHATERALSGTQWFRIAAVDSVDVDASIDLTVSVVPSSGSTFAPSLILPERTSEGWVYWYAWDASNLTVPSATVRLDITGQTTGASTVEFIGVEWLAELIGLEYDSGLIEMGPMGALATPDEGIVIPDGETYYVFIDFSDFVVVTSGAPPILGLPPLSVYTPVYDPFHAGRLVICPALSLDLASPDGFNLAEASDDFGLQYTEADFTAEVIPNPRVFGELTTFKNDVGIISSQVSTRSGSIRGRGVNPFLVAPFAPAILNASTGRYPYTHLMWSVLTSWSTPSAGWFTGDGSSDERWDLNFSTRDAKARRLG